MIPAANEQLVPPQHQKALRRAVFLLNRQSFAVRLADHAGQPIDRLMRLMPKPASGALNRAVEAAILKCLNLAIRSLEPTSKRRPMPEISSLLAGLTGGLSGFVGFAALPIELPVTTTLMLRSIADIARHYGEDLSQLESRLACIEVFGLGSGASDRRMDIGYYASRALLSKLANEASAYLIERTMISASTPMVNSLLAEIVSRFGVIVSERMAASAVPILGAVGGATINMIFMDHFQRVARGHFTVRRLERRYGEPVIRQHYERMSSQSSQAAG